MNFKSLGGVLTPKQRFVCLRCRLGNGTINLGQRRRYQQTSAQSGIGDATKLLPLEMSGDSQDSIIPNSKLLAEERQPTSILGSTNAITTPLYTTGQGSRADTSSSQKRKARMKKSSVENTNQGKQLKKEGVGEVLKTGTKRGRVKDTTKRNPATKRGSAEAVKAVKEAATKAMSKDANKITKSAIVRRVEGTAKDVDKTTKSAAVNEASTFLDHLKANELEISVIQSKNLSVPGLSYGLERVLFNPGVYQLQDQRSRVFNFDPYLQTIMPVEEFNFNAIKGFTTPSEDEHLKKLAEASGKRYVGSSSSLSGVLAHFHFLLSNWREVDYGMLSRRFSEASKQRSFTQISKAATAVFLRWRDGSYAVDVDKEFDTSNLLSSLGQSMEKLLTSDTKDFERYRKSNPDQRSPAKHENYHYCALGNILMRSQIDAYDARLPGTGMFDLKTRSVVSIRMDLSNYKYGMGYQIKSAQGKWESYEREYFDMIRSAFLKYSLQVRMGRMDGVFVAYHNIENIFGFQYISLPEMDKAVHGTFQTRTGDLEFKVSLELFNKILDKATKKYPETSLRLHFEAREDKESSFMYAFAEPMTEVQIETIQSSNLAKVEDFERSIGLNRGAPLKEHVKDEVGWADIEATVEEAVAKDELALLGANVDQESSFADANAMNSDPSHTHNHNDGSLYSDNTIRDQDDENLKASSSIGDDGVDTRDRENDEETRKDNDEHSVDEASDKEFNEEQDDEENKENIEEHVDRETNGNEIKRNKYEIGEPSEIHTGSEQSHTIGAEAAGGRKEPLNKRGEVLAMLLTIRNKTNGKYVLRPEELGAMDDWTIEYSLVEEKSATRAWSLYEECKQRRQESIPDPARVEASEYTLKLRAMSEEGAIWRKSMDENDKGRPRVVLEPPLPEQELWERRRR